MCGIAGVIGKVETVPIRRYLDSFNYALAHRGPDDSGFHIEGNRGFLNRRLAIVDVAGGRQPIMNEDGTVGIVYNGEIYNYGELQKELLSRGRRFSTRSDTEVVLRAYEEYGVDAFRRFNGMFAFCLWDNRKDAIYLVRDHIGIKPLYIYEDEQKLIFSSELKGILGLPDIDLSPDPAGFQDYLTFRYVQAPYTFFKRVCRLDAGAYLEIKQGRSAQYRYWDVSYEDPYPVPDLHEVKEELLVKLRKAVESQLMGEVPIGVLLSGGIDSSTIAYFIHECGANLTTFNIGFPEVNEFEYSRAVAKRYGLNHVEILTTTEELTRSFDAVMLALDEPIADPACFPLYILARELKKHVTVVLSGEGGDEVFAGYPQYGHVAGGNVPYAERFRTFMDRSWYFSDCLEFLTDRTLPPHTLRYRKYFEEQPLLNGMLSYDMKTWLPENLMMKADKIMMAHSLEGRFPFLDRELLEYVSRLPQRYKLHPDGTSKWLLREVIAPRLPESVIKRPKMGFTVPVDKLLERLKPLVLDVCDSLSRSSLAEVLTAGRIKTLVSDYYHRGNISSLQIWTLFVMAYWFAYSLPRWKNEKNLLPGRAQYIKESFPNNSPQQKMEMRRKISEEFIAGDGIEIGALHAPLATSEKARVKYVDILTKEETLKRQPEIKDCVTVDIIDDGEILSKIDEGSLDFIIGNHFLEHCEDPLGTLRNHLSKIRRSGILYYAVPNKDYTFDKDRPLTTFEHLLKDNREGPGISRIDHYREYARYVDKLSDDSEIMRHANILMETDNRIHFHVWDAFLFEDFINRAQKYLDGAFDIECFVQNENEIVVVLRKTR